MKRLVIDRLDLDLRGVSPATAEQVARLLGPALARALRGWELHAPRHRDIDAGQISTEAAPEPASLATQIAQRIAHRTSGA